MFVYRALTERAQFGDTELELHHLRDHYELLRGKVRDNCRTGLEVEFEVRSISFKILPRLKCFIIYSQLFDCLNSILGKFCLKFQ